MKGNRDKRKHAHSHIKSDQHVSFPSYSELEVNVAKKKNRELGRKHVSKMKCERSSESLLITSFMFIREREIKRERERE